MNSLDIFSERVQELEDLPEKPNIFWYVSAGDDFRGPVFLSDHYINYMNTKHGKQFSRPDLFVFNCLGHETDNLHTRLRRHDNPRLFSDRRIRVTAKNFQMLTIKRSIQETLQVNPEYMYFCEEYVARRRTIAFFFEVDIVGVSYAGIHYEDTQKILYFAHENIDFFNNIILKNFFNVEYLCATREGCGMGGCRKSIVEHIYKDGDPLFYSERGFRPAFNVLFNDFTADLFEEQTKSSEIVDAEEYCKLYPQERGGGRLSTVYRVGYFSSNNTRF